jgi:hypothetical protein
MYKKIPESKLPRITRNRAFRFESTQEWKMLWADVQKGIQAGRALQISLTDDDKLKYRVKNRKTVWRFVKMKIEAAGLPYEVTSYRAEDMDHIVVKNAEAKSTKRTA